MITVIPRNRTNSILINKIATYENIRKKKFVIKDFRDESEFLIN